MEQKYYVFKKEDVDRLMGEGAMNLTVLGGIVREYDVSDCFVIRFQDVLAGPGLHAYAGAAQTMIEGARTVQVFPPTQESEDKETVIRNLSRVRDAAFEAANAADEYPNKKVPD